ncbi:RNA polymerase sigma factor [Bacillus daqingensis]|uniref:RNA polymerase sigma factor n=1 Tax=Bacillus daqingensis TaxID=872396 RepID=A0ABV9NSN7_9BACI
MSYERELIAEWYEAHSRAVMHYVLVMVKDVQQAEDLTHDVFIKAYRHAGSFRGDAQVKTWLFQIAHRTALDFLRKKRPLQLFDTYISKKQDPERLPADVLTQKEETETLYRAITSLKSSYRSVITLRKIKQFTTKETAAILGWTESKVKVQLHRAMPELERRMIKEQNKQVSTEWEGRESK